MPRTPTYKQAKYIEGEGWYISEEYTYKQHEPIYRDGSWYAGNIRIHTKAERKAWIEGNRGWWEGLSVEERNAYTKKWNDSQVGGAKGSFRRNLNGECSKVQ